MWFLKKNVLFVVVVCVFCVFCACLFLLLLFYLFYLLFYVCVCLFFCRSGCGSAQFPYLFINWLAEHYTVSKRVLFHTTRCYVQIFNCVWSSSILIYCYSLDRMSPFSVVTHRSAGNQGTFKEVTVCEIGRKVRPYLTHTNNTVSTKRLYTFLKYIFLKFKSMMF